MSVERERKPGTTVVINTMPRALEPKETRVVVFLANRHKKMSDKEVRPMKHGKA